MCFPVPRWSGLQVMGYNSAQLSPKNRIFSICFLEVFLRCPLEALFGRFGAQKCENRGILEWFWRLFSDPLNHAKTLKNKWNIEVLQGRAHPVFVTFLMLFLSRVQWGFWRDFLWILSDFSAQWEVILFKNDLQNDHNFDILTPWCPKGAKRPSRGAPGWHLGAFWGDLGVVLKTF